MKARKIKASEIPDWYEFNLCEDFPVNEVKPLDNILKLCEDGRYDIFCYFDEAECSEHARKGMGYATIWKAPGADTYLLDYLGVPRAFRNQGLGAKILRDIRNQVFMDEVKAGKYSPDDSESEFCLIVESETPLEEGDAEENLLRKRRCEFYRRNGYVKVYEMGTCGVRFDAMVFEKAPKDLEKVMREHKKIYGVEREDVIVPLGKNQAAPLPFWMKK